MKRAIDSTKCATIDPTPHSTMPTSISRGSTVYFPYPIHCRCIYIKTLSFLDFMFIIAQAIKQHGTELDAWGQNKNTVLS